MKLRRLPETDLARIAPLTRDEKRRQLRSFNSGGGSWSYDPARSQNFNIANPLNPLGLHPKRPTIDQIKRLVARQCSCDQQEISCLEVVDLFDGWFKAHASGAIERRVPSMAIGSLGLVRYWENFAANIDHRYTFIFIDYRRKKGLTAQARKFVFSMMNEQIRISDPEFVDANLMTLRFPQSSKESRTIIDSYVNENDLFTLSELGQMIDETYEIWIEVLAERKTAEPKRGTGGLLS